MLITTPDWVSNMPTPRKPRRDCLSCGKQLNRPEKVYCNNICQGDYRYREYIAQWQAGLLSGNNASGEVSSHVRRYLIEKHGAKCSRCNWSERNPVTGRVPVCIDHIDGDWRNTTEENLRFLCPNCHSLTPTYQALNKGKGRPWRYKKVSQNNHADVAQW